MIAIYGPEEDHDRRWSVWTEPEGGKYEGRCVGVAATKIDALVMASTDLIEDWIIVHKKILEESKKEKSFQLEGMGRALMRQTKRDEQAE